jgi:hypothetical protein
MSHMHVEICNINVYIYIYMDVYELRLTFHSKCASCSGILYDFVAYACEALNSTLATLSSSIK